MLHTTMQEPDDICQLTTWSSPDEYSFWTVTGWELIANLPFEKMRSGEISRLVIIKAYRDDQRAVDPVALWEWPDQVMRYVQHRLSSQLEEAFMQRVKVAAIELVAATYDGSGLRSHKYAGWRKIFADRDVRHQAARMLEDGP